jgi:hypothetical protein
MDAQKKAEILANFEGENAKFKLLIKSFGIVSPKTMITTKTRRKKNDSID